MSLAIFFMEQLDSPFDFAFSYLWVGLVSVCCRLWFGLGSVWGGLGVGLNPQRSQPYIVPM
jgi:hypothetical protein